MEKKEKVLLGMSGGVDSSVSALLLKRQGYEVFGVTFDFTGEKKKEAEDAKKVCECLQIPHYNIDAKEEFQKRVIDPFIDYYQNCFTPNPCIECNRYLKFGVMYEFAKSLGISKIATGHYARIAKDEKTGEYCLLKSASSAKDQSYVLYAIPKEVLSYVLFPLEGYTSKEEIRAIAKQAHLPIAQKPDSQDICFIPDGNYAKFLETMGQKAETGRIVNRKGEILGTHQGLYHYTIGQRKGLGISYAVPLFVLGFNQVQNELIVGEEKELYQKEFWVTDWNWLLDEVPEHLEGTVKIRYHAKEAKAEIVRQSDGIKVCLDEPQRGITPGQSAVFYQGNRVLGGGKIGRMRE